MDKRRILIVDDQPEVLRIYARALEIANYEPVIANSATAAMELIQTAPPDAILLDLKMPFVNGLGFLYRLRAMKPTLPVALVTGVTNLDDTTVQEIASLNAELAYKPLGITDIQTLAEKLLRRSTT
ncbi:MAG TPA: response regulator [Vicinamibacterales bacterium]|nr:response regulator [Vicinamibacterales bacterium]